MLEFKNALSFTYEYDNDKTLARNAYVVRDWLNVTLGHRQAVKKFTYAKGRISNMEGDIVYIEEGVGHIPHPTLSVYVATMFIPPHRKMYYWKQIDWLRYNVYRYNYKHRAFNEIKELLGV